MKTVLITGANGLIGTKLSQMLVEKGYTINYLTRTKSSLNNNQYYWNINEGVIDINALQSADYIIHLAGEALFNRLWTKHQKKKIYDSRVNASKLIVETIKKHKLQPKAIISASAIGYYGYNENLETEFKESDKASTSFLGNLCFQWEKEISKTQELGIRTVCVRTGIVLAANGDTYKTLRQIIKLGLGAGLGNGKQYFPWIHIEDLCAIYISAIEEEKYNGPYNAVAPDYKTNQELVSLIAKSVNKKLWLPNIPAILLNITLGEMAKVILTGNKISPQKIIKTGFLYKYPTLKEALINLEM